METEYKCEKCGKPINWKRGGFQTGTSRRFYHFSKKGNKLMEIASWCSRKCYSSHNKSSNKSKGGKIKS